MERRACPAGCGGSLKDGAILGAPGREHGVPLFVPAQETGRKSGAGRAALPPVGGMRPVSLSAVINKDGPLRSLVYPFVEGQCAKWV